LIPVFAAPVLAAALALMSVVLASPVSALLARARWPHRAPGAALVLWQSICLAAGVCLVGAGLVLGLEPLGGNVLSVLRRWSTELRSGHPLAGLTGLGIVAGTLSGTAAVILFGVLVRCAALAGRRRRAHRHLLDLLTGQRAGGTRGAAGGTGHGPASPVRLGSGDDIGALGELFADVRILDHAAAVAYTVPGWHSRVVLTAGMLDLLDRAELVAVIDHERAHVRSRHDLLVLPFQAWATAVGWLPGVRAAAGSVAELTEMLADDRAVRRSAPRTLARALATVALAGIPGKSGLLRSQTPAVAGRAVSARVDRLLQPRPLPAPALISVYLVAFLLLAVPAALLLTGWR